MIIFEDIKKETDALTIILGKLNDLKPEQRKRIIAYVQSFFATMEES